MTAAVFLAGIVMPASLRYAQLFRALGGANRLVAHELAIYEARPNLPPAYSIDSEVERLDGEMPPGRCHLYGHSAGGAIALAYAAAHPERLLSLTLDEPSTDFSHSDLASDYWTKVRALRELPERERIPAFRLLQVDPSFTPPALPDPRPSWMDGGPTRIAAFGDAVIAHRLPQRISFDGPVAYTYGSLTNPRFERIARSLEHEFARFELERYDGLHHLESAHQARPAVVAAALRRLWDRASATTRAVADDRL